MRLSIITLFLIVPCLMFCQKQEGFIDFTWQDSTGKVLLHIPEAMIDADFLYVNSLAAGVGSNDIGLDRGQLGDNRVVRFYKSGKKMLLIEDNLKYRAISDNAKEVASVKEAFAKSVLFGFEITESSGDGYDLDATPFLLRDAHGVAKRLKQKNEGTYDLDKSRSAVYKEGLFNFPDNTELEALLTFKGGATGSEIRSVTPTPDFVTVRQHHSFVRLPDDGYLSRKFHPESGYFYGSFYDYAAPIGEDMEQRFILRHRLEKKNPEATMSEAIEPIVYYIDSGCPEPVKSALMEGGRWWNQAFTAAGYKDAFQVKELPEGAHPLDVRYNMIQWVHRSTRGWSYGASVSDPRTGEIIKGHVSLGSLRVRQDYLIAQGMLSPFDLDSGDPAMLDMALARLRQLSAHEIGHTIGLAHNFASSYNNRASVMDYPHPYVTLNEGQLDFAAAYDQKIGEWDKQAIIYGYGNPTEGQTEKDFLKSVLDFNRDNELLFITDQDARSPGGLHPLAHLWDNGSDPIGELERISILRAHVLANLGNNSLPDSSPHSDLEKVLVPAYLMHRYQVEAVAKLIGGYHFEYSEKPEPTNFSPVDIKHQKRALDALLKTMDTEYIKIPDHIVELIPPTAYGHPKTRETFAGNMGSLFDPLAAAESAVSHTLTFLLNPQRLSRLTLFKERDWNLDQYLNEIFSNIQKYRGSEDYVLMKEKVFFIHLLQLSMDSKIDKQVKGHVNMLIDKILLYKTGYSTNRLAHLSYLRSLKSDSTAKAENFKLPSISKMPPGSPIGCH